LRLLYLSNPRTDFLQDLLYHGLASILGAENVVDYPPNGHYHGERPETLEPWDFPMLFFDFPRPDAGNLDELLASVDAVVVPSLRPEIAGIVRQVVARRARPIVFVDGEDHCWLHGMAEVADVAFKREVLLRAPLLRLKSPPRRWYHRVRGHAEWSDPLRRQLGVAHAGDKRALPMPLAVIDYGLQPEAEKETDVVFLGSNTHELRRRVATAVEALSARGLRVVAGANSPAKRPSWEEYVRTLSRARVGISVRGGGFDTYRYWETPYAGAVLVAETPQIALPDNFVHGEDAFFAPVDDLVETAVAVLERDDLPEIAARGRERVLRHHTSVARAQRLLDHLPR
jgi:hypothetical protein